MAKRTLKILTASLALICCAQARAATDKYCTVETGTQYQLAKDYAHAAACFEEGVAHGDGEAAEKLGMMRLNGLGGPADIAAAHALLLKADALGVMRATFSLGMMYETGVLGKPDLATAAKYYRVAAEHGYQSAQMNLGFMYLNGKGAPLDYAEGEKLVTPAANAGNAQAQFNLGLLYMNGYREKESTGATAMWLERAALNGHPMAPLVLGGAYAYGKGVTKDFAQAYTWFLIAKETGNEQAAPYVEKGSLLFTEAQRAETHQQVQAWMDKRKAYMAKNPPAAGPVLDPVYSRCAVFVNVIAPPAVPGDQGAASWTRLFGRMNQAISERIQNDLGRFRLVVLDIKDAEAWRAGQLMQEAMRKSDCAKGLQLNYVQSEDAAGPYVEFKLVVLQKLQTGTGAPVQIHEKVLHTDFLKIDTLDYTGVAKMFGKDVTDSFVLADTTR